MTVNAGKMMRKTGKYIHARRTVTFGRNFGHSGEGSRSRQRLSARILVSAVVTAWTLYQSVGITPAGGYRLLRDGGGNDSLADTACLRSKRGPI
jgi:hypothetical protein